MINNVSINTRHQLYPSIGEEKIFGSLGLRNFVWSIVIGIILGMFLPFSSRELQCAPGLRIKFHSNYYRYQDIGNKDRFIISHAVQAFYPFWSEKGWTIQGSTDFKEGNSGIPGKEEFRLIDLYISGPLGSSLWTPHLFIGRLPFYFSPSGAMDGVIGEWKNPWGRIFLGGGKQVYNLYRLDKKEIPKRWSITTGWDYRLPENGFLFKGKWGKAQLSGISLSHLITWRQLNSEENFPNKHQSPLDLQESQGQIWGKINSIHMVSDLSYDWLNNTLRVWETEFRQRKGNLSLSIYHRFQRWRIYQTDSLNRFHLEPVNSTGIRFTRNLTHPKIALTGGASVRWREEEENIPQIEIGIRQGLWEGGARWQMSDKLNQWGIWLTGSGDLTSFSSWSIGASIDRYRHQFTGNWEPATTIWGESQLILANMFLMKISTEYYRDVFIKNDLRFRLSLISEFS